VIKLYYAPRTRSIRVRWLLEELGLPHQLEVVEFRPPAKNFFGQQTPLKKLPTLEDGDLVMCESGAILEYLLERYGEGRLAPPVGSPLRPRFLQWMHFADSTAFPPLGIVVWLVLYRQEGERNAELIADARGRADAGFAVLEDQIGDGPYLLGADFSAADIMNGFTLGAARALGVLDDRFPRLGAYLDRLEARPAYQRAVADV